MSELIHDRGRGPEVDGTRITVYNLMPYFLEPSATEEQIAIANSLTVQQVAAARAYVLNHPDEVLQRHLEIERKIAAGNPPEVAEQARRTHELFLTFKEWLREQQRTAPSPAPESPATGASPVPAFREWLSEQAPQTPQGS